MIINNVIREGNNMRALFQWSAAAIALAVAAPGFAQQPTQAQAGAIRSACRGDYPTYCSSVPTGAQAALQCLQQNAGSVSAGCQQALSALGGGAAPAQGGGESMGAPMGQPMGQAAPPPAPPPPPMRRPMPPPPPPMSPRQEMAVLRGSCGYDFRRFCRGVQLGGGRGLACLKAYGPSLTPQCQGALLSMRGAR